MKEPESQSDRDLELDLWRVRFTGLVFFGIAVIALILIAVVFTIEMRTLPISIVESRTPDFQDIGFVLADNTWVSQNPQENSPRVFNLVRGTGVFILKKDKGWYKIWIQGQSGWVKEKALMTRAERAKQKSVAGPEIKHLGQEVDENGNLVVKGEVVNKSDDPIMNIRIRIDVFDSKSNLSDQSVVYVATDKPLSKGRAKTFTSVFPKRSGKYQAEAFIESWQ